MRICLLLLVLAVSLPAAAVSGSGPQLPGDDRTQTKKEPAWVADPTEGGKVRAVTATWAAGADRDTQRQVRKDAIAKLRTTYKLAENAKVKEMDLWVDAQGATFILLVAR